MYNTLSLDGYICIVVSLCKIGLLFQCIMVILCLYGYMDHCSPFVALYQRNGLDSYCGITNLLHTTCLYAFYYYNKYENKSLRLNIFVTVAPDFFKDFSWCFFLSWSLARFVFLIIGHLGMC